MPRKCFIIMPFDEKFDGIWETVIKPTIENYGDKVTRADNIFAPGSILQDIFSQIKSADYILADLTEQNPNVYYELGLAHASEKPVILITLSSIPFDLSQQRVIEYSDTAAGAAKLKEVIAAYLDNIMK